MAQPIQGTPTVTANLAGTKQQVNLRDYLNVRIAPFLKKALNEALDAEAQYPLQWLGEHLIQQSVLFEGNPDTTNIQERFLYPHPIPAPTETPAADPQPTPAAPSADTVPSVSAPAPPEPSVETVESPPDQAADQVMDQAQQEATEVNGTAVPENDRAADPAPIEDTEMSTDP